MLGTVKVFDSRDTAAEWHGGQWSALYALQCCGELPITDDKGPDVGDAVQEIESALKRVAEAPRGFKVRDVARLGLLLAELAGGLAPAQEDVATVREALRRMSALPCECGEAERARGAARLCNPCEARGLLSA